MYFYKQIRKNTMLKNKILTYSLAILCGIITAPSTIKAGGELDVTVSFYGKRTSYTISSDSKKAQDILKIAQYVEETGNLFPTPGDISNFHSKSGTKPTTGSFNLDGVTFNYTQKPVPFANARVQIWTTSPEGEHLLRETLSLQDLLDITRKMITFPGATPESIVRGLYENKAPSVEECRLSEEAMPALFCLPPLLTTTENEDYNENLKEILQIMFEKYPDGNISFEDIKTESHFRRSIDGGELSSFTLHVKVI